jgi:hypothetical protein
MADKEVREIHTHSGGDGGMAGVVVAIIVAAVVLVGGFFIYANGGMNQTASGPNVTIKAPSTTGSGGGTSK